MTTTSQPARRIPLTIWMVFMQLLALATLVVWFIFVGISIVFHDDPNPPELSTKIFLTLFYSFPFYSMGAMIVAWVGYFYRVNWLAWILSALQLVPAFYIVYEFIRAS
ncbi:MAG: hypothetical protein U0Z26_13015 [Anaerolineales bacterium]